MEVDEARVTHIAQGDLNSSYFKKLMPVKVHPCAMNIYKLKLLTFL